MDVTEKAKEIIMPLIEAKKEVHLNRFETRKVIFSSDALEINNLDEYNDLLAQNIHLP